MMIRDALRLIGTALPDRRAGLARIILLATVAALAEGGGLMLLAVIINGLPAGAASDGQLERALAAYVLIVAVSCAAVWGRNVHAARLRLEAADRLRREAFDALLQSAWPTLRRMQGPAVTQIITTEAARVGVGIDYLMTAITLAARLPVLFGVAYLLSAPLAIGTLAISALATLVTTRFDRRARHSGEQMIRAGRVVQTRVGEAMNGRRVIKAFGLEHAASRAFAVATDEARSAHLAQQRTLAAGSAGVSALVPVAAAAALWVAVRVMGLDMGRAVIFALTYGRLGQSVLALRSARRVVIGALPAELAVRSLIADAREDAEPAGESVIAGPARAIHVADAWVRHEDGTVALAGVSAEVRMGAITALVGPSGAGKSTLADLVMGLGVPASGTVALDGRALDAAARRAWRRQVGYVPQESFLFDDSIRSNLLAGRPEASEEDLWHALDESDAAEFVRALPRGLDTIAGERGTRLSGGEAQRVALARALLRRPALLVLDEPTSAIDAEAEARILETLERLKPRLAILIVTHRQSLAAAADHVIRLERGRRVD